MSAADHLAADARGRLTAACRQLGLEADPAQLERLLRYLAQLQRWNRTYNLTAIRDVEQMLVQHLFGSLAVVMPLEKVLGPQAVLFDVGSGGGLPGVVLATMRTGWNVTCVDAVDKKMAFVRQMSGALGLPNLQALHARIETIDPAACDAVVSRAFASLEDFAALAGPHVKQGGDLVAMKGKTPEAEIDALHAQGVWQVQRIEPLAVPELDAQRCLIWMRRR